MPGPHFAPPPPEAPKLTMPAQEAGVLREAYEAAQVILEYGSGGSTELAARLPGRTVFSVENDAQWLMGMQGWFAAHPPVATVHLHGVDIGPTGKWGMPRSPARFRTWPLYPNSVWDRADFQHPDVVLVDGRFRTACFLTTLFRITRPVTLLWDDYLGRPPYREVESLAEPTGMVGRMAIFDLKPTPVPVDRLSLILMNYLRPA